MVPWTSNKDRQLTKQDEISKDWAKNVIILRILYYRTNGLQISFKCSLKNFNKITCSPVCQLKNDSMFSAALWSHTFNLYVMWNIPHFIAINNVYVCMSSFSDTSNATIRTYSNYCCCINHYN